MRLSKHQHQLAHKFASHHKIPIVTAAVMMTGKRRKSIKRRVRRVRRNTSVHHLVIAPLQIDLVTVGERKNTGISDIITMRMRMTLKIQPLVLKRFEIRVEIPRL